MRWPSNNLWGRMFPELELFESEAERKGAFKAAKNFPISWRAVPFLLSLVAAVVLVGTLVRWLPSLPFWLGYPAWGFFGGALLSAWLCWFFRREMQRNLRHQLLDKGIPVCINCGYQLRGLTESRCPECSKPFDPKLLETAPPTEDG